MSVGGGGPGGRKVRWVMDAWDVVAFVCWVTGGMLWLLVMAEGV